jgi:hypothetical protein
MHAIHNARITLAATALNNLGVAAIIAGTTGRPRGRPQGSKSRPHAITAEAFESLTEEQIQALKPIDMFRLVALTAVRQRNIPLILKAAADWALYEHAKLAPFVVGLPQESEEDKARRLHEAMRQMRETVGDVPPIGVDGQ